MPIELLFRPENLVLFLLIHWLLPARHATALKGTHWVMEPSRRTTRCADTLAELCEKYPAMSADGPLAV
jgi:hypothetical protein